jgi:hypothetical protein
MALVVQTGRELLLEIDGDDFSIQTAEVTLTPSQTVDQYVTLTGSAAKSQPVTWTLNVRAFQDWGEVGAFTAAMIFAAVAGDSIPFQLTLPGGGTASGNIVPVYPPAGGSADGALEMDLTFAVDGAVTFA